MDCPLPPLLPPPPRGGRFHRNHRHHPASETTKLAPGVVVLGMTTKTVIEAEPASKAVLEAQNVCELLELAEVEMAELDVDDAASPSSATALAGLSPAALLGPGPQHLLYGLDDQPPALMLLLLAAQHCFLALLHCLLLLDSLSPALCLHPEDPARAGLLCRLLLASAVATLANNTSLGLRLGMVHGPCVASIAAVLLVADLEGVRPGEEACPSQADQHAMGFEKMKPVWQPRARRVQATLLIASALSAALSAVGLPRLVARFHTPLTAAVATFLSALPLVSYAVNAASGNWTGALSGALGVLVCALALRCVSVPVPVCSVRRGGLGARALPAASLLAVLLPLAVGWATCALLTAAALLSPVNRLVTSEDREGRVHAGGVFAVPWPVPWGWPSLAGVPWVVVASAVCASLVANTASNLTTFYAAGAAASGGVVPSGRSLQRGTLVASGVAFVAALWGAPALAGGGQEAAGVVPLTQAGPVAAARVAGVLLAVVSFFPALAAGLAGIPLPLLAGVGLAVLGAGAGQGLRYLRCTDLRSPRNCVVLGVSVLTGLVRFDNLP